MAVVTISSRTHDFHFCLLFGQGLRYTHTLFGCLPVADVVQALWKNASDADNEIDRWQPYWIDVFQDFWMNKHSNVPNIAGSAGRMVMDAGWKLRRRGSSGK